MSPTPQGAREMLAQRLNRWRVRGTARAMGLRGGRELFAATASGAADPPARSSAPRQKAGAIFNQRLAPARWGLDFQQREHREPIVALPITGCRDTPSAVSPPAGTQGEGVEDPFLHPRSFNVA